MLPIAGGVAVPLVIFPSDHAYFGMVGAFVGAFVESFFGDGRRPPLDLTPWADILGAERAPFNSTPTSCSTGSPVCAERRTVGQSSIRSANRRSPRSAHTAS